MGSYIFRLPDIGEGIAEAEIVAWHVKVGDEIGEDARLADVMTDKATVELESPVAGVVTELAGEAGDRLAIGSPLVVLEVEGEGESMVQMPSPPQGRGLGEGAMSNHSDSPLTPTLSPEGEREKGSTTSAKVLASPAVRARARRLGIDLGTVRAGSGGRIGHAELDALLIGARAHPSMHLRRPTARSSRSPVRAKPSR